MIRKLILPWGGFFPIGLFLAMGTTCQVAIHQDLEKEAEAERQAAAAKAGAGYWSTDPESGEPTFVYGPTPTQTEADR